MLARTPIPIRIACVNRLSGNSLFLAALRLRIGRKIREPVKTVHLPDEPGIRKRLKIRRIIEARKSEPNPRTPPLAMTRRVDLQAVAGRMSSQFLRRAKLLENTLEIHRAMGPRSATP